MSRRVQFSLRALLVAATIFCAVSAWLGWCARRASVQLDAANKLRGKGVSVAYRVAYPDFLIPLIDDLQGDTGTWFWHFRCQGDYPTVGQPDYLADERSVQAIVPDLRRLPCLTTVYVN